MRLFVAIALDEPMRAAVAREQQMAWRLASQSPIKFVTPEHAHLTLAFLGEVPSPQSDAVVAAMERPMNGCAPFDVTFGGLGAFPPRGAPRVLWLGLLRGAREVIALQAQVAARLTELGVELEDRAFHPHLTLGRWRESKPSDRPAPSAEPRQTGTLHVDRVTLYESRLSSEGPTHIARAHARLERSTVNPER